MRTQYYDAEPAMYSHAYAFFLSQFFILYLSVSYFCIVNIIRHCTNRTMPLNLCRLKVKKCKLCHPYRGFPDQNGVSLQYIMLEIHHSGWKPSILYFACSTFLQSVTVFIAQNQQCVDLHSDACSLRSGG